MELTNVNTVSMTAPVYSGGGDAPAPVAAHSQTYQSGAASASAASGAPASAEQSDAELAKLMEEPIKQANKVLTGYNRFIEREYHEVTKVLMYKIKDTETNEVIAEYPPKKIQDMIAKMWELAGLFIDQKA